MAYIKDKVKPVENSRGPAQGSAGSESSQTPKTTIVDVIEWVRLHNEAKLWKIDTLDIPGGQRVAILVGRAPTRDNRTFPAVVIRLLDNNGNVVRDYTVSARLAYYLIAWYSETTDKKASLLIDFVKAMSQSFQQRTITNTETEDLGE